MTHRDPMHQQEELLAEGIPDSVVAAILVALADGDATVAELEQRIIAAGRMTPDERWRALRLRRIEKALELMCRHGHVSRLDGERFARAFGAGEA